MNYPKIPEVEDDGNLGFEKFASRLNGGRPGEDGGEWHLKFTSRLKEGRARLNVGLIVSVRVKVDSLGLRKLKNHPIFLSDTHNDNPFDGWGGPMNGPLQLEQ